MPASAIQMASAALKRELEPCIKSAEAEGISGTLLLDLTITATSGVGHIQGADVVDTKGAVDGIEECLLDAAARVQFDWTQADGETKLRYPVRLGN